MLAIFCVLRSHPFAVPKIQRLLHHQSTGGDVGELGKLNKGSLGHFVWTEKMQMGAYGYSIKVWVGTLLAANVKSWLRPFKHLD